MRRRGCLLILAGCLLAPRLPGQRGGELHFALRAEPKTFHPLLVADEPSETVRYLTAGVLIRVNRRSQQVEPELASAWQISDAGRKITFDLRQGISFSDGSPFSAEDVAHTIEKLMDPALHSPTADSFRSGAGVVKADVLGSHRVAILFPAPVAGLDRLFDQVAILSSHSEKKEQAVLGPFFVAEHRAGSYILLRRNPRYWKQDAAGRRLPYLDSIRLTIQRNPQTEMLRFQRGEYHLINDLSPELFERLRAKLPASVHDAGPSLGSEMMWFNQVEKAPIPAFKKAWFRSQAFRRAISEAIQREDLVRVVYRGHGRPAAGPVSPANLVWFKEGLKPQSYDPAAALKRLRQAGFQRDNATLRDREGNPVEFSLITNAGNASRERIAAMMQQDLVKLGVRVSVAPLDFPSLIERISRTFDYEACLLGLVNVDLDPNGQMNVWLSSARNHQWNPSQEKPETPWEAEIDRLMQAQASVIDPAKRKALFDEVQQIVWEQAPFIYLVHKNSLSALSPRLRNTAPGVLWPQTFWNVERLYFAGEVSQSRE